MKKLLLLIAIFFVGGSSLFASEKEAEYAYIKMPMLIFDLNKKDVVVSDESLKFYDKSEYHIEKDEKLREELKQIYKDKTELEIEIVKVQVSNNGKYAYVYSYHYALNVLLVPV